MGYGFIRRCALYWNSNAIQAKEAKASDSTSSIPATHHEEVITATSDSISSLCQSLASCDHGWVARHQAQSAYENLVQLPHQVLNPQLLLKVSLCMPI